MMKKCFLSIVVAFSLVLGSMVIAEALDRFPAFQSKTPEGVDVTEAVFAEKKLTMINLWGTFCPPCIDEMPDLGNLGRTMPEGTQLIGIILDVGDKKTLELGKKILKQANADFMQILPVYEMNSYLRTVSAVPTTIFVDSQGNIVGAPLVGSRPESAYRAEIEKILKSLP